MSSRQFKTALILFLLHSSLGYALSDGSVSEPGDELSSGEAVPVYGGFLGGMMAHGGYFFLLDENSDPGTQGFSRGIGGKAAILLGDWFRLGTEGYSTRCSYDDAGSSFTLGWGGLTIEAFYRKDWFQMAGGLSLGGGKMRHLDYLSGTSSDLIPDSVIYTQKAVFLYTPTVSFEFFVKDNLAIVFKVDCLMSLPETFGEGMTTGPRFYLGTLFFKKPGRESGNTRS